MEVEEKVQEEISMELYKQSSDKNENELDDIKPKESISIKSRSTSSSLRDANGAHHKGSTSSVFDAKEPSEDSLGLMKDKEDEKAPQELEDIYSGLHSLEEQVVQSTLAFDDVQSKRMIVKTLEDKLADSIAKQVQYKKEIEHLTTVLQFGTAHPNQQDANEEPKEKPPEEGPVLQLPTENHSMLLKSQLEVMRQERRVLQDALLSAYLTKVREAVYNWMVKYHSMSSTLSQQTNEIKQLKDQLLLKNEENIIITNLLADHQKKLSEMEQKTIEESEAIALKSLKSQNQQLTAKVEELGHEKDAQLQLAANMQIHFETMQNELQAHLEQMTLKADQWKCQHEALQHSYDQFKALYQEMYAINAKHRSMVGEKLHAYRQSHRDAQRSLRKAQKKLEFFNNALSPEQLQERNTLWSEIEKIDEHEAIDDEPIESGDAEVDMLDLTAVLGYITTNPIENSVDDYSVIQERSMLL